MYRKEEGWHQTIDEVHFAILREELRHVSNYRTLLMVNSVLARKYG
jgi:hypothetical protein